MRLAVHANPNKPGALALARRTLELIGPRAEVVLSEELGELIPERPRARWSKLSAELLVAIGGDGTFLHALRRTSLPLLPVNAGTLGVLAEVGVLLADGGLEPLHLLDQALLLVARERGGHVPELELFEVLAQAPDGDRAGARSARPLELLDPVPELLQLAVPLLAEPLLLADLVVELVAVAAVVLRLAALPVELVEDPRAVLRRCAGLGVEPVPTRAGLVRSRVGFRPFLLELFGRVRQAATAPPAARGPSGSGSTEGRDIKTSEETGRGLRLPRHANIGGSG